MDDDQRELLELRQHVLLKQEKVRRLRARLAQQEELMKEKEQYDYELSKLVPVSIIKTVTTDDLEAMVRNSETFTGFSFHDIEMSGSEIKVPGKVLAADKEFVITAKRSFDDSSTTLKKLNVQVAGDDDLNQILKSFCNSGDMFKVLESLKEDDSEESN